MNQFDRSVLNKYVEVSKFTVEKHPNADLYIYGYHTRKEGVPIIWDSLNTHLRGIILDENGRVIQRPFRKFFTFKQYITKTKILLTEGETMKLPDCNFKIYEKVDGSMATLYWIDGKPYLCSQRSFVSPNAVKATEILYNKYNHLLNTLRKDVTYVFEVLHPNTRVMVNYDDREDLVLLGIVDNETGEDLPTENTGFSTPKDYTNEYGHIKDLEELVNLNISNLEGFVLQYENGLRVKLKFPWFSEAHFLASKIMHNEKVIYESVKTLRDLLNLPSKTVSNIEVWQTLKNNQPISHLTQNIMNEFYSYGFEAWLKEMIQGFTFAFENAKRELPARSITELWDLIKPETEERFDLESRKGKAQYSTPMWNFMERISNKYL